MELLELGTLEVRGLPALKKDFSVGGLIELDNRPPQGGLPAAALAHKAQRFPFLNLQGDAVNGLDNLFFGKKPVADIKIGFQIFKP